MNQGRCKVYFLFWEPKVPKSAQWLVFKISRKLPKSPKVSRGAHWCPNSRISIKNSFWDTRCDIYMQYINMSHLSPTKAHLMTPSLGKLTEWGTERLSTYDSNAWTLDSSLRDVPALPLASSPAPQKAIIGQRPGWTAMQLDTMPGQRSTVVASEDR